MDAWLEAYVEQIKDQRYAKRYIYGAGKVGKIILKLCRENGVEIDGFLVTDAGLNPQTVSSIPVYQFNRLRFDKDAALILIGIQELGEHKIAQMLAQDDGLHYLEVPKDIFRYDEAEYEKRMRPALEITPKVGCAINCKYCPQERFLQKYHQGGAAQIMLPFSDFKKCLNKLPRKVIIDFSGFVEPFLNPESVAMMKYAHIQGYEMELYTTLQGLSFEGFEKIKDIPFKHVVLHTADAERYAKIAVTEDYLKLLAHVVAYERPDGSKFVDKANCQGTPHPEVLRVTEGKIPIHCELTDRAGNLDAVSEIGLSTTASKKGRIRCIRSVHLDHNVLLPDGRVVLCCNDFGMEHVLGNLLEESYEDIINGAVMQEIKEMMELAGGKFLLCRKCVYAEEI